MTIITPALPVAVSALPVAPVTPVAPAAAAAAVVALEADPLLQVFVAPAGTPGSAAAGAASAAQAAGTQADGAAMRHDQLVMARQLSWPAPDGAGLATSWRSMVKAYGSELQQREQQWRSGQLPGALLMAGAGSGAGAGAGAEAPGARALPASLSLPGDAWRFTVHAGARQAHELRVMGSAPDEPSSGRRRRARAALRLDLVLADGSRMTVQAEPVPGGIALELCASDSRSLAKLEALQPKLREAVERTGVRVLRWALRDRLPVGMAHARLAAGDAAAALTLPVFRAVAELALVLPAA